jgi:hypothetical protein
VAEEGTFAFPNSIEAGPETFQEYKFLTLWEAWSETPLWEIFADARRVTPDLTEQRELLGRVLRELRSEGFIEVVRAPVGEASGGVPLDDAAFEADLQSGAFEAPDPAGENACARPTAKAEQWRRSQEPRTSA